MFERLIDVSRYLASELRVKELSRRAFIAAALGSLACGSKASRASAAEPRQRGRLIGVGGGAYADAVNAAIDSAAGARGLAFIGRGDVVYLKVNTNSGDPNPYSTKPELVELVAKMAFDRGARKVLVGDRSFWGDDDTKGNLVKNGIADAAKRAGAELVVFEDDEVAWVTIGQDRAPDWVGGFRFPRPVVEADHIINMPCIKTHFISTFTMGLKNIIGLVNPVDRRRDGNLRSHVTEGGKLYRQIAQLNRHITPTLTILDGMTAVIRGGPNAGPRSKVGRPGVILASTDRIAADAAGLAVLKCHAAAGEAVHRHTVWDNPQIAIAIRSGVGVARPEALRYALGDVSSSGAGDRYVGRGDDGRGVCPGPGE